MYLLACFDKRSARLVKPIPASLSSGMATNWSAALAKSAAIAAADAAVAAISSGEIKVHDIMTDGACPQP